MQSTQQHSVPTTMQSPRITVKRRPMAWGDKGARQTIHDVARQAKEQRNNPFIHAWSVQKLKEAKDKGRDVLHPRNVASILLESIQREFVYANDPYGTEMIVAPEWLIRGFIPGGDCFAEGTLVLTEGHRLVPVERVETGTRIWGLHCWTRVVSRCCKGTLPIDVVFLNNGSQLRLTSGHKVNVLLCPRHAHPDPEKTCTRPCSCPINERELTEMRVEDLVPGMVLATPERLPFGADTSLTPEQAYIEGLYISDGWSEESRFAISGKDGCPKEAQKREVKAICDKMGLSTYWHEKYIRINDAGWNQRMKEMGSHAPDKHLLSLDLGEAQAAESLRGIMADSGENTCGTSRTLTTTSRLLAVQARVLHKMFGITCGWRYIEDHGGLGKNPIWRVSTRGNARKDGRAPWLLRVQCVEKNVTEVPCYDLQTEDHHVYLPEHDVTVRNCDDLALLVAGCYLAALASVGIRTAVVGHSYEDSKDIQHILNAVHIPDDPYDRSSSKGVWLYADASTKNPLGPPPARPTWELVIDPMEPDKAMCDAVSCLAKNPEPKVVSWHSADYVGVAGPPRPSAPDLDLGQVIEPEAGAFASTIQEVEKASSLLVFEYPLEFLDSDGPFEDPFFIDDPYFEPFLPPDEPGVFFAEPEDIDLSAVMRGGEAGGMATVGAAGDAPSGVEAQMTEAMGNYLVQLRQSLGVGQQELSLAYERMREVCTSMGVAFPPNVPGAVWDALKSKEFEQAQKFLSDVLRWLDETLAGERKLVLASPDPNLPFDQRDMQYALELKPSDTYRYMVDPTKIFTIPIPQMGKAGTAGPPVPPIIKPPMVTGGGMVGILFAIVTIGMIYHGDSLIRAIKNEIEHYTNVLLAREANKLANNPKYQTPEQVDKTLGNIQRGTIDLKQKQIDEIRAEADKANAEKDRYIAILDRVLIAGGLGLLVVVGVWAWGAIPGFRMFFQGKGGAASRESNPISGADMLVRRVDDRLDAHDEMGATRALLDQLDAWSASGDSAQMDRFVAAAPVDRWPASVLVAMRNAISSRNVAGKGAFEAKVQRRLQALVGRERATGLRRSAT